MNMILRSVVLIVSISMCYSRPQMEDKAEMPMPVSTTQLLPKHITLKFKSIIYEYFCEY